MRRLVLVIFASSLLVLLIIAQRSNIPAVEASTTIFQGDLVLTGNNVTVIEERFDINGSIIVKDNATLILRNAMLNFTATESFQFEMSFQNPSSGNPRLGIENATITAGDYYLEADLYGNSTASVNMLSAPRLYLYGYGSSVMMISNSSILDVGGMASSIVNVSNCSLWAAEVRDNSTYGLLNCTIQILQAYSTNNINVVGSLIENYAAIVAKAANCSVDRLAPGFVTSWGFQQDCSVLIAPGGWASNLTLTDTQVDDWVFEAYSTSNVTISNSDLRAVYLANTAKLRLTNSTFQIHNIGDQSEVLVDWYLDVHVVDSIGQDVPSAIVNAYCSNATLAGSEPTDAGGWARLTLMEKMLNATGEYPVGNYTVEATYETHSNSTTIDMTDNQIIILELPDFVIPEFPSFLIIPLFMTATLLTAIIAKRKQNRT